MSVGNARPHDSNVEDLEAKDVSPPEQPVFHGESSKIPRDEQVGWRRTSRRIGQMLKDRGVEDRGIVPRPEDVSQTSGDRTARWPGDKPLITGSRTAQLVGLPASVHVMGRVEHQHPHSGLSAPDVRYVSQDAC